MSETGQDGERGMPDVYFDIARLDDGRFCVQLVRRNSATRTSYTPHITDVLGQIARARLPIRTQVDELQRACREQALELLA